MLIFSLGLNICYAVFTNDWNSLCNYLCYSSRTLMSIVPKGFVVGLLSKWTESAGLCMPGRWNGMWRAMGWAAIVMYYAVWFNLFNLIVGWVRIRVLSGTTSTWQSECICFSLILFSTSIRDKVNLVDLMQRNIEYYNKEQNHEHFKQYAIKF